MSVWTERSAQRQVRIKLQLALAQLEQQQQAAEALRRETQDQSLRDNVTGLYQKVHFEDQLRPRGRPVRASTASSRWSRSSSMRSRPKRRPWAQYARTRIPKRWAGCCAAIRGRWTPPAGSTTATSRCCSRRGPGHGAFAHGRPATPVRHADRRARRAQSRLHRLDGRGELPAHRPRRRRCCRPPKPRSPRRASAAETTSRWPASASSWSELGAAGLAPSAGQPPVHHVGRQRIEHEGEHALELGYVQAMRHACPSGAVLTLATAMHSSAGR